MLINEAIAEHLDYLSTMLYSNYTVVDRHSKLSRFAMGLPDAGATEVATIASRDVVHALAWVRRNSKVGIKPGIKAGTMAGYIVAVKTFFKWAWRKAELIDHNPADDLEVPRPGVVLPRALNALEMDRLLHLALPPVNRRDCIGLDIRNRMIVLTSALTALRRGELAALNWEDVDLEDRVIHVRAGKENKDRTVPIVPPLDILLTGFRQRAQGKGPVFVTKDGRRCAPRSIHNVFARNVSREFGTHITAHQMRHSFATHARRSGWDLHVLQEWLGHESINTTAIYDHVVISDLRQAANSHPFTRLTGSLQ